MDKEIGEQKDLSLLEDISLKMSVRLGSTKKMIIEILSLKEGDVIELEKNTEDYIDVMLNDKKMAIGEIVVINDKYGVRIVDLA
ncbi:MULTISPECIES: FliM/FliN family flagellar motor switch protein [unclassified Nitratiruptor]|uniref:FliM/FliN family flagellar motor switch protein n=1 Tax=unclassified Nitratiruptor TaxID=2624044 RepID=UPI0019157E5C|nr:MULTISPECIES: FliM/FliN family flagellar motor switch protein [unclassified Nitratiruptor]BCD59930.1 flagellar motor switch protein FliN/FliY [Nitratiruptor sp. YY08-10]BCD63853.1 flagellar motor switch protein FliN/FliY [Nitratiruptor sp. YY08-14]